MTAVYISDFETRTRTPRQNAWDIAATVCDPEIPVLTIEDLGILRDVQVTNNKVTVTITPTYSGCPAMDAIRDDVKAAFAKEGIADVTVDLVLAPAWTTDWMTEAGKAKLREYGIALARGSTASLLPRARAMRRGTQGPSGCRWP